MRLPEETQECRDKVIPIELSMAGHNSFYHECSKHTGRTSYAVCQHTIDSIKSGAGSSRAGCQRAVERAECPAMKMRDAEREAGRALFYSDRRKALAAAPKSMEVSFGRSRRPLSTPRFGGNSITGGIQFGSRMGSIVPDKLHVPKKKSKPKSDDDGGFTLHPDAGNFMADVVNNLVKKESTES